MVQESPVRIAWYREPGGIKKAHIAGAVGTDAVTGALYKCGADIAQIEAFQQVLDDVWSVGLNLLTKGGIITTGGKVIATDINDTEVPPSVQVKIAEEGGILVLDHYQLSYCGYDSNDWGVTRGSSRVLFVGANVISKFSYTEPRGYPSTSTQIYFEPDKGTARTYWDQANKKGPRLHRALTRYMNNLRESRQLPKLIGADAAVNQLFIDAIDIYNQR